MSQEKQKHPIGLSLVNISIALQSYAGYAVSSVLILFFTADINRNGLGLSVPKRLLSLAYIKVSTIWVLLLGDISPING